MSGSLAAHLQTGLTTVCRCWKISRKDGISIGFTDHDEDVEFDGVVFKAGTGLSPAALAQASGLSVDNTEAIGALDGEVLSEDAIAAGQFDGAEVVAYLVNWTDVEARETQFRGHLGEIVRAGGQFRAEVRGRADALNQPRGRVFQKPCSAVLGDINCGFDISQAGFLVSGVVVDVASESRVSVDLGAVHPERWFERGLLRFSERGGYEIAIKRDDVDGEHRSLTLWSASKMPISAGETVELIAGCDRRFKTCQKKFSNIKNFRGFPDIPGEDWVIKPPSSGQVHDGGSRR